MVDKDMQNFNRRTFLKATGAAGATAATSGLAAAAPTRQPGAKENEVLVGVSAGNDLVGTVEPGVPADAEIVHKNEGLHYVAVRFPSANSTAQQQFIESIQKRDAVKYAEINATHEAFYDSNDPKEDQQYSIEQVQSEEAWDTTLGDSSVLISVVDQGVQYDHEDLSGNMYGGESNHGQDFVDDDEDPYPDNLTDEYHGTHVSGCASAVIDNSTGVAGQSNSSIMSARSLSESGSGSTSDIADAVKWSADQGADIINMSLGGGGYTDTMKNAVSYAQDQGSILICAAGNDGKNSVSYPAAYSECVAISAVNNSENLASFSNYGSEIELCAPGVDILSTTTTDRGTYEKLSGTSMATPVVSGVAGLTLAQWNLTNTELRNHLKGTAKDIGLSSEKQGCGQANAYNAVTTDPANRSTDCAASGGGGGGGTCGDTSTTGSASDTLYDYTDYDCWSWAWNYSDPCQVVVELDGPSDADFDLFVSTGETDCPGPNDYDYASYSTDSQEKVTIDNPDTSTDLQICVDSYSGDGDYTLYITEKTT